MIHFLLFFLSVFSWAKFDLSTGLQGRTLPTIGAEVYADSGYNFVFWGKKEDPKDFLYGLIRPSVGVSSSGVINGAKAELEFFPISILGITVGRQIINSNFEFPFFDCDEVNCKGEFQRNYVEGKAVIGAKGWILMGNYKVDHVTSPDRGRPMADWRNVIVGDIRSDVQIEKKLLLAKTFNNKLIGILGENVQFQGSRERKESYAAVYQFKHKETSYMFGAGAFHTSQEPMGLIFYFRAHHVWFPSLKLF